MFPQLSELPKTWKALRFLSTIGVDNVAFGAIKILWKVGVDIFVDRGFQSYENPDNFKSWRSLFHHLWIRRTVNYIILPHVLVCHTVRNVGLPRVEFSYSVGPLPSFLCNRSFHNYENPDSFKS